LGEAQLQTKLDLFWRSLGAFAMRSGLQQLRWEDEMFQDFRYGFRMLRKHKGFTAVAVLTLALGIGANTALFSIVNAALLRPLPFPQPEQLVQVWSLTGSRAIKNSRWRWPIWPIGRRKTKLRAPRRRPPTNFSLIGNDEPERISGLAVTANYFQVIGVTAAQGRDFRDEDGQPAPRPSPSLSHGFLAAALRL